MNVLFVAALTQATGNAVTAHRLARLLGAQHRVTLVDATQTSPAELRAVVERERIDAVVALHALLAGPLVRTLGKPYALVFGGTDLYEEVHPLQQRQMAQAVASAHTLVAFSAQNRARAEWLWPSVRGRVAVVPQSVDVSDRDGGFSLRARLGLRPTDLLAVLPTGIRRVKDPIYGIEAFSVWHALAPRVHLAVIGAVLEPDYAEDALLTLSERPGVHFVPALERPQLLAAIADADVVLNSSLSEGMCGVLLEAFALSKAVIARRNAGNESLVLHGHTGLLYDSPNELVQWVQAVTSSEPLRARLCQAAGAVVARGHGIAAEQDAHLRLVEGLRGPAAPAATPKGAAEAPEGTLDGVDAAAATIGLDGPVLDAVRALVDALRADPELDALRRGLGGLLASAPPSVAIAAVRHAHLEARLGVRQARTFYLLLGLLQVAAARSRHATRGVDPETSKATLTDLALWARVTHATGGGPGIALQLLEAAQRYLRGDLFQIGKLQFELRAFSGALRAWRDEAGTVSAIALDGVTVDLRTGLRAEARPHAPAQRPALEPGSPVLEMSISGNAPVGLREIGAAMRAAYALFARIAPEARPVAVCGESWRLDPQIAAFLPESQGITDLQRVCHLYPSTWSELRTLRRLFGPDADRASVLAAPLEALDPMQGAVARFLRASATPLSARSGFVLREEAEAMPEW